jgi:hypothetical protein
MSSSSIYVPKAVFYLVGRDGVIIVRPKTGGQKVKATPAVARCWKYFDGGFCSVTVVV